MAIEILDRKEAVANLNFERTCSGCDSKIRFHASDATVSYCLGYPDTIAVKCPVCGCNCAVGLSAQQQAVINRDYPERKDNSLKYLKLQ